jgi:hypothetical protein
MSNEPMTLSRALALCAMLLLVACTAMERPVAPTPLTSQSSAALGDSTRSTMPTIMQVAGSIPSWNPQSRDAAAWPKGPKQLYVQFGQDIPQWDFHPDAGCWEHAGPDGWTRQVQYKLHVPHHSDCGGWTGRRFAIRCVSGPGHCKPVSHQPDDGLRWDARFACVR